MIDKNRKHRERQAKEKRTVQPLTKKRFESLLTKAAQPVSSWKHSQEETGTSAFHPSDDCSDKHMSQDKTEGKEG